MIDPKRLVCVGSKELLKAAGAMLRPPCAAYVDRERGVVVQVWDDATPGCIGTPWEGTLRVSIKHTRAKSIERIMARGYALPITWDDMQAIKDHFWPERIGIEIFPPHDSIVDVADMRWMWVLPKGAVLPFNLQSGSLERLES